MRLALKASPAGSLSPANGIALAKACARCAELMLLMMDRRAASLKAVASFPCLSPPKKGMNFHTSSILPKTVPGPTDPPSPTKILDRMPVTGAWISCVNV